MVSHRLRLGEAELEGAEQQCKHIKSLTSFPCTVERAASTTGSHTEPERQFPRLEEKSRGVVIDGTGTGTDNARERNLPGWDFLLSP